MFDESTVLILGNSPVNSLQKTITADVQEYSTVVEIGDYKFNISKRLFIDYIELLLDINGYLKIENMVYKILNIKEYSDYQEIWLYLLNRQSAVI